MAKKVSRKMISDEVWEVLEEALSRAKHSRAGEPWAMSERDFVEALLYLDLVGAPWRDLPAELGYWHAVYMRFRRWEVRGVWPRLAGDGIEPVIPPINSRCKILPYDKALYSQRNLIERFFHKIKTFRRIATRYDKRRKTFFAVLYLVSAFLIIENS